MPFLYNVRNVKIKLYAKGLDRARGGGGGRKHFRKTFSIFYMLNSRNRVFNPYLAKDKNIFADDSRVETNVLTMENRAFS